MKKGDIRYGRIVGRLTFERRLRRPGNSPIMRFRRDDGMIDDFDADHMGSLTTYPQHRPALLNYQ